MIRKATIQDVNDVAKLALLLWPDHSDTEMRGEMAELLEKEAAVIFLAHEAGAAVGFAQCQLRRDYVEGTETSPVGYLEGIFVAGGHRNRGIAEKLLLACENWAREQGCREFASDCELDNFQSLQFHLAVGFQEANRIICFAKKL